MWIGFEQSLPVLARLRGALGQASPQVHVYAPELESRRYLAPIADDRFSAAGRSWRLTEGSVFPDRTDVLLMTSHSADLLAPLWNLRRDLPQAVCLLWQWDNHHHQERNLRTVLAADGYFPGHEFCVDYLMNPYSANLGHVPLCTGQWTKAQIGIALAAARPRSDCFLAAYTDYDFSARREFLYRLAELPQGDVMLMSPVDQRRYFGRPKAEQLAEWCGYKTSVVVPLAQDLSNRLFDALACGQIPLVSDAVRDLDRVIPPATQALLPILRYREGDADSVLAAHAEALRRFDAEGEPGIRRRHRFTVDGHLLPHRLVAMLETLVALGDGRSGVGYDPARGGLALMPSAAIAATA